MTNSVGESFGKIWLASPERRPEGSTSKSETELELRKIVLQRLFADGNLEFWRAVGPFDRILAPGSLTTLNSLPLIGRGWRRSALLLYSRWYCFGWTEILIEDPVSGNCHEGETLYFRRRFLSCVLHSNQLDSRRSYGRISAVDEEQAGDRVLIDVHREYIEYPVDRLLGEPHLCSQSHPHVATTHPCPSDL